MNLILVTIASVLYIVSLYNFFIVIKTYVSQKYIDLERIKKVIIILCLAVIFSRVLPILYAYLVLNFT